MGLGVENTRAFSAHVTEEALNELWGSFSVAHTNVKDWKDYEKDDVGKKKFRKLKLRTALVESQQKSRSQSFSRRWRRWQLQSPRAALLIILHTVIVVKLDTWAQALGILK
jgi:hypothetical protein